MPANKTVAIVAGAVVAAGSLIALAQLGPLSPPSGPVADTGPSLAALESGTGLPGGLVEYEVFTAPQAGEISDQLQSSLVHSGRVFVKSLVAYNASATAFDGAGQIDSENRTVSGTVAGRISIDTMIGNTQNFQASATTVELNVVVEDGLNVSWIRENTAGFVTVVYLPLD